MLESNLAPKGSPAGRLCHIFVLLRLRMSPYAYAYRTGKHLCAYACAYAYACVVRVNQALNNLFNRRDSEHDLVNSRREACFLLLPGYFRPTKSIVISSIFSVSRS